MQTLVLVIGDMHIPQRAVEVPEAFRKLLSPGKIQTVLCTGNLCDRATLDWVKSLARDVHIVKGAFDQEENLSETKVVTIAGWKLGLMNGYQIIPAGDEQGWVDAIKTLDCDVLISGNTHVSAVQTVSENKHYMNPGSATGAYNALTSLVAPSMAVLSLDETQMSVYLYRLVDDSVSVSQTVVSK